MSLEALARDSATLRPTYEPPITTTVFEPLVWTATIVVEAPEPRVMDEPGSIVWPPVTKLDDGAGLGVAVEPTEV